jgi:hypothetical protein
MEITLPNLKTVRREALDGRREPISTAGVRAGTKGVRKRTEWCGNSVLQGPGGLLGANGVSGRTFAQVGTPVPFGWFATTTRIAMIRTLPQDRLARRTAPQGLFVSSTLPASQPGWPWPCSLVLGVRRSIIRQELSQLLPHCPGIPAPRLCGRPRNLAGHAAPTAEALRQSYGNYFERVVQASWNNEHVLTAGDNQTGTKGTYLEPEGPDCSPCGCCGASGRACGKPIR